MVRKQEASAPPKWPRELNVYASNIDKLAAEQQRGGAYYGDSVLRAEERPLRSYGVPLPVSHWQWKHRTMLRLAMQVAASAARALLLTLACFPQPVAGMGPTALAGSTMSGSAAPCDAPVSALQQQVAALARQCAAAEEQLRQLPAQPHRFLPEENRLILEACAYSRSWDEIAAMIPGRPAAQLRRHYHLHLQPKVCRPCFCSRICLPCAYRL